eukprot:352804-Chlamydomonas_euryale.AAC.1
MDRSSDGIAAKTPDVSLRSWHAQGRAWGGGGARAVRAGQAGAPDVSLRSWHTQGRAMRRAWAQAGGDGQAGARNVSSRSWHVQGQATGRCVCEGRGLRAGNEVRARGTSRGRRSQGLGG